MTKRTANAKNKNNQTWRRSGKNQIKSNPTSLAQPGNFMFNKKIKKKCEICSKLTIKITEHANVVQNDDIGVFFYLYC